jgi:molybdenum-dependent DNA-binding transcriptional regulator ModE
MLKLGIIMTNPTVRLRIDFGRDAAIEERVVNSSSGGLHGDSAKLTPFGRSIIPADRRFELMMQRQAERHFTRLTVQ